MKNPPKKNTLTRPEPRRREPVLRFTPMAWAKLLYFRDRQETEIGGFGITAADNPLLVTDFLTVKQDVTMASVSFDDEAVADYFEDQVDRGRRPEQFCRVWLHTHPGNSAEPSGTDLTTFHRVFGKCEWAVMFILASGGRSIARLRFNVGPCGDATIPIEVDYSQPFAGSDHEAWEAEYRANIRAGVDHLLAGQAFGYDGVDDLTGYTCPDDWLEDLEAMEPAERQLVLAELSARPDLWEDPMDVQEVTDEFV